MTEDQLNEKRTQYPEFLKIVDLVSKRNPLQSKRIQSFIMNKDNDYWRFSEELSKVVNHDLLNKGSSQEAAKAYNDLCVQMLRDQIQFRKTGKYPTEDPALAQSQIYDQPDVMRNYMMGLLISQMLWPNHYTMFRFFQSHVSRAQPQRYLEVGAGHGLLLIDAIRRFPQVEAVVCDISQAAIDLTKEMLCSFHVDSSHIKFMRQDFFGFSSKKGFFDFITLGEILEHVKDVKGFMKRVYDLIAKDGKVYLSTCANCPAADHVYHFHSVKEIQETIGNGHFLIEDEIFLSAEDVPESQWEEKLITINYAALLKPKDKGN